MRLSIIIPVLNEEKTIQEVLERVRAVPLSVEKEILVVDDGSTDATNAILEQEKGKGDLKVLHHERNRGKGAAIRTALDHATGDWVIIQDADLELNPEEYPGLLEPLLQGKAQVVYGSRFLVGPPGIPWVQRLANWGLTWFTNLLFGSRLTDMETCYKVIPLPLLRNLDLRANRFDIEPEITAKLLRQGYRIHEVPITYKYRDRNRGKKMRARDGFSALYMLIKCRVSS
ncbi:MAG: glycosyltransferase family 2 protein [Anaerolineae bacterium]